MSAPERLVHRFGPVSAVDLALFAAASGDHNPLHLDLETAKRAGFERQVVHGMLTMAYVARLFTKTFGPGSVLSLQTRFVGAALLGDTVEFVATLASVADGAARYDLRARTQAGTELVTGTARVATT